MALPADPLIAAYNGILAILEADADFSPLYRAANFVKDTQPGWLIRHLAAGPPSRYPQLAFSFGDYVDGMYSINPVMPMESATFLTDGPEDWWEPISQTFTAKFTYDVTKHDSTYQHGYERAFITALRRAGPKLGMINAMMGGITLRRNPKGVDDQGVTRPINTLTFPVTFQFSGRSLL